MIVRQVTITNFQLKQLFEEFNSKLGVEGITAKYSKFMFANCQSMIQLYNTLLTELYDERRETDYPAMVNEHMKLIDKYCDTDSETKAPILDTNGNKVITKNVDKYNKEFQALREKYKELFERIDKKTQVNNEIFNRTVSFNACLLDITEFPASTKPYIVGLLST